MSSGPDGGLPPGEAPLNPLAPRARLLFHLQAGSQLLFLWAPLCVGLAVVVALAVDLTVALVAAAGLFLVTVLAAVWLPSMSYDRWGWLLRDTDLLVRHGVVFRIATAIPIGRIQHVDVRQGPIEQWLGLARVHVHTASGVGSDGTIPGLEAAVAEELRDQLVARSRRQGAPQTDPVGLDDREHDDGV